VALKDGKIAFDISGTEAAAKQAADADADAD
jgi:hypothetical protein